MAWARVPSNPKYQSPEHLAAKAAFRAAFVPGDPCCLCGHPMWPPVANLHADHDPQNPSMYRGLAHGSVPCQICGKKCNIVDGAKRARARQLGRDLARRWAL